MSIKYPALPNTTYPDKIQTFEEKLNITPNDATLVKQVQQLIEQRKFAEANAIRQQISNYKQKQLVVQDWNEMADTVVALQLEYNARYTPSYVLSKEKPDNQSEGDYWYRITNIKYIGETEEIGEGEKSPENPYVLKGQKVPNTDLELYSLPNGVYDEYDDNSKIYIKRIQKIVLNGDENFFWSQDHAVLDITSYGTSLYSNNTDIPSFMLSSNLMVRSFTDLISKDINGIYGFSTSKYYLHIRFKGISTLEETKQKLSTQPTTVLYELETPEIIQM